MARTKAATKRAVRKGLATKARHKAFAHYERHALDITPDALERAQRWYSDAHRTASEIADILRERGYAHATIDIGACILSAFSPRQRWDTNKRKAIAWARGETVQGLRSHHRAAERCLDLHVQGTSPFAGLRGKKTHAFARNIAGDQDAITIDVWMLRAANIPDKHLSRTGWYEAISQAVRDLAARLSLPPCVMQAALWIVVRGSDA